MSKKTETKEKSTEVATASNNALIDVSSFGGFSPADIKPSNIILIQGDNPLKDELGVKNGEFVADNISFGGEFEFIPVTSKALMDVFSNNPKQEGVKPEYLKTIDDTDEVIGQDGKPVLLFPVDDESAYPTIFLGNDGLFYQRKKILIVVINGLPYKLVFKSQSKHFAFKKIIEVMFKACKINGLSDPIEGVFKLFSKELLSQKLNKKYQSLDCSFIRAATGEELAAVAPYRTVDFSAAVAPEAEELPY